MSDLQIKDLLEAGKITVNDVRRHRGLPPASENHPGKGEEELGLEVAPVEEQPREEHDGIPLAALRRMAGLSTTRAHVAEITRKSPTSD